MDILHIDPQLVENLISQRWYWAIFGFMSLESMFLPFPSEIVMIPAWIYAAKGVLNLRLAILAGISGSIFGALINYFLAFWGGRPVIGRMISKKLLKKHHRDKGEEFFKSNWEMATFVGRLIPVVRQYISFPAGLWQMNIVKFVFYTWLGAWIWVSFLALSGYYSYRYMEQNPHLLQQIKIWWGRILMWIALIIVLIKFKFYKSKDEKTSN